MAINTAFFNQLKSAFVPLLKRVIALIPTKTSDLINDSDFLTESDVTQATRRATQMLGTTPTFLVSDETTAPGGNVTAGAGTNAGTTTYALRRYTVEAVRSILGSGSGTDLTNLTDAEAIDDEDAFPIIQPGEQLGEVDVRKVSLAALQARLGHCTIFGSFTETGGVCTVEDVDSFDLDALLAAQADAMHAVFFDGDDVGHVFRAADVDETVQSRRLVCDEGNGVAYVLTAQVYADEQDVPEDDYYLESTYQGATVYVAFRLELLQRATKNYVDTALAGKQDALTFDNTPTANSENPVKSAGIKTYVDQAIPDLTNYATKSYADAKDTFFPITGTLNLATMAVTNLSCSFAEALAARAAGKNLNLRLDYTSPVGRAEAAHADLSISASNQLRFFPLMIANFGAGNAPYLFNVNWWSEGMTVTPFQLAVQS